MSSVWPQLPPQIACKVYPDVYLYPLFITYYRHIIITSPLPWPLSKNTLPLAMHIKCTIGLFVIDKTILSLLAQFTMTTEFIGGSSLWWINKDLKVA